MQTPSRPMRPLAGIRVIECGSYWSASLAATHLAGLGASVIRVLRPTDARGAAEEELFKPVARAALACDKIEVRLDLKREDGRRRLVSLVSEAEVFITNFTHDTLLKHKLDASSLSLIKPGLIHVWLPGFASSDADDVTPPAAWEAIVMASAGIFRDMGINRQLLGVTASYSPLPLASAYASVWAALAVCAALFRDVRLGIAMGEAVEVPLASALLETLCHNSLSLDRLPSTYLSSRLRRLAAFAASKAQHGGANAANAAEDYYDVCSLLDPFYASYTCRDARPFYLVCPSHRRHQERCLAALGLTEKARALQLPLADTYADAEDLEDSDATDGDEGSGSVQRHGLGAAQVGDAHAAALRKLIRAAFLTRTAYEWEEVMGAAGVPGAAHRSTSEWLQSEHARASGLVQEWAEGTRGEVDPPEGESEMAVRPGPIAWVLEAAAGTGSGSDGSVDDEDEDDEETKWLLAQLAAARARKKAEKADKGARSQRAHEVPTSPVTSSSRPPSRPPASRPPSPKPLPSGRTPWLEGVKAVDLCNVIAGPTIGAMLARFGAEVNTHGRAIKPTRTR